MGDEDRNGNGGADRVVFPRRNRELVKYLVSTFTARLDPQQVKAFARIAAEIEGGVDDNCRNCLAFCEAAKSHAAKDPRRHRFLLRLVVAKLSHLFAGDKAIFPRALVEGVDRYLFKAMGEVIYKELNAQADDLLYKIDTNDDKEMLARIADNLEWARFAHTILVRILLKFERFAPAKRVFITVVGGAIAEQSRFRFDDGHFHIVFDTLFGDLAKGLKNEDQRVRWDYLFGDDTSQKLAQIFKKAEAEKRP